MNRKFLLVPLTVISLVALGAKADDPRASSIPTVSEVDAEAWAAQRLEKTEYLEWKLRYLRTLRALIVGDSATFYERLTELESDAASLATRSRSQRMSLLYSWAVEAGLAGVSVERYQIALSAHDQNSQGITVGVHGEERENPATGPEWGRVRANLYFLMRDERGLESLTGLIDDENATVDEAYYCYLSAQADGSLEMHQRAIRILEPLFESGSKTGKAVDQGLGLIALWLGTLHESLAMSAAASERQHQLFLASEYASVARKNLELLDVPILFGRALELTSSIDGRLAEFRTADNEENTRIKRQLEERSRRALDLSAQYL